MCYDPIHWQYEVGMYVRPHLTSHMNWFNLPLLPVNVQEYAKCVGALQFQFACLYFPPQGFFLNPWFHWNWLHLLKLSELYCYLFWSFRTVPYFRSVDIVFLRPNVKNMMKNIEKLKKTINKLRLLNPFFLNYESYFRLSWNFWLSSVSFFLYQKFQS